MESSKLPLEIMPRREDKILSPLYAGHDVAPIDVEMHLVFSLRHYKFSRPGLDRPKKVCRPDLSSQSVSWHSTYVENRRVINPVIEYFLMQGLVSI